MDAIILEVLSLSLFALVAVSKAVGR